MATQSSDHSRMAPLVAGAGASSGRDAARVAYHAIREASENMASEPTLVVLTCGAQFDEADLLRGARVAVPNADIIGGTSGWGICIPAGVVGTVLEPGVAALALGGTELATSVGSADVGEQPRRAGEAAARAALAQAPAHTPSPRAVLLCMPPGSEEQVLQGVISVVGRGVPLLSYTVAAADIHGHWRTFANDKAMAHGVGVALLYGDIIAGSGYATGYRPAEHVAHAAGVSGRMVERLGPEPAADVYARWLGVPRAELGRRLAELAAASPLGIRDSRTGEYMPREAGHVTGDGSLGLLGDVAEEAEVRMLGATHEELLAAAGEATAEAMTRASLHPEFTGALLMAQGAGRVRALGSRAADVAAQIDHAAGATPFLSFAGFGEQSSQADGRPVHLNLSVTVLALGA